MKTLLASNVGNVAVSFVLGLLFSVTACSGASLAPFNSTMELQSSSKRQLSQRTKKTGGMIVKNSNNTKFQCPDSLGLPLGDINILVVTDIHGWIAGQHARHEPEVDVDFGALVSLYQRIRECAPNEDFFLLFNGDFMDGTGLSTVPPEYLGPLIQKVPFSALNVGNHELYFNEVVDYMVKKDGFIDSWKGNYLASNVDYVKEGSTGIKSMPFGNRYTFLHGANRKSTILTFGFLYNFFGNCNHTKVQLVEEALQEEWFVQVLTQPPEKYNAIIMMGHFDAVDDLVYTILNAVRALIGSTMPIYFVTGHTHRRHYQQLDPLAATLEAGRFMDTIGFASFPLEETAKALGEEDAFSLYQHRMLNANMDQLTTSVFKRTTSNQDFYTRRGRLLTLVMQKMQKELGLLEVVTHCAPQALLLEKPIEEQGSLWWFYVNKVVPKVLFPILKHSGIDTEGSRPIFIQGTGALRYSLLGPTIVVDDIIAVSPFENPIMQVGANLTARQLNQVFKALQVDEMAPNWGFKNFGIAGQRPDPASTAGYSATTFDLYTTEFHVKQILEQVHSALLVDGDTEKAASLLAKSVYPKGKKYKNYHIPPHRKEAKKRPMDATNLWFEFFHNEWKCPTDHSQHSDSIRNNHRFMVMTSNFRSSESIPSEIATLAAVFLILLYALGTMRPRRPLLSPMNDGGLQLAARREPRVRAEATPLLRSSSDESGSRSYS